MTATSSNAESRSLAEITRDSYRLHLRDAHDFVAIADAPLNGLRAVHDDLHEHCDDCRITKGTSAEGMAHR